MSSISIRWHRRQGLTYSQLLQLLEQFGDLLPIPLRKQVDLPAYAEKLLRHAELAFASSGDRTVGLVAIYANDPVAKRAHIPLLVVLPSHRGAGIGRRLLLSALRVAGDRGMLAVDLEVAADNVRAQSLYRAAGFATVEVTGIKMRMARAIPRVASHAMAANHSSAQDNQSIIEPAEDQRTCD